MRPIDLPSTRLLTPAEVEHLYGLRQLRLQEWRARGGGPPWCKIGRSVFYKVAVLEDFIAASAVEADLREASRDG